MNGDIQKTVRILVAVLLVVISVAGVVYGSRVWQAQRLYFESKYGTASDDPARIIDNCRRAYALYPFNYRFCLLAAEAAHDSAAKLTGDEAKARLALAELWCRRGIVLNPYPRGFQWLLSEFLWKQSPEFAIDTWRRYVDWDFWSPYNHSVLADMYVKAGDIARAEKELAWTKDSEYYAPTLQLIAEKKRAATPSPASQGR
jgi:hypothetical protein